MKNIDMKVKDKILTVTVDLSKEFGASQSGKTTIIASTEGNIALSTFPEIKVGINVYKTKI